LARDVSLGRLTLPFATLERLSDSPSDLVLFLHGLGCVKEAFAACFADEALSGRSLVAPDFPGHGQSPAPEGFSCKMEDLAAAVGALLAHYEYERLHIVAHSMGGAVGLLLAEDGVALASFVNIEGNLTADDCGLLSRRAAATPEAAFVADNFAKIVARARDAQEGDARLWGSWMAACDARAFHRSAASLVAWSDSGRLLEIFKDLKVPKAYLYGERSANPPVLAALGDIPRTMIEGAGHFVMTDRPGAFLSAVEEVIRTV
jgi:pimeloyl-ACP methyl ester carboxylesterase